MTLYATPYSLNKNLLESYNDIWSRVEDDEWAVVIDGDAMHTTNHFGHSIEKIIEENKYKFHVLTCMTNRVGNSEQVVQGVWNNNDMQFHREMGAKLWDNWFTNVQDITNGSLFSGVLIAMNGATWRAIYNNIKNTKNKMLGIDNDIHLAATRLGLGVGIMKGIYVMHYYRNGNQKDKSHLL